MAGFVPRKYQRFKEMVPALYRGEGVNGEGVIKDLSLTGGAISGNVPVRVGQVLELQLFVSGDKEPLLIDAATVQWVKGAEFGVLLRPQKPVAEKITALIAEWVKKVHGGLPKGD